MTSARELKDGMIIQRKNSYYRVIEPQYIKPANGAAFITAKLENLFNHGKTQVTFSPNDEFEVKQTEERETRFSGSEENEFCFESGYEIIKVKGSSYRKQLKYINQNETVKILSVEGKPFAVKVPDIVERRVIALHDKATLDNGAEIAVPSFVQVNDLIRVNSQTGEFISRK